MILTFPLENAFNKITIFDNLKSNKFLNILLSFLLQGTYNWWSLMGVNTEFFESGTNCVHSWYILEKVRTASSYLWVFTFSARSQLTQSSEAEGGSFADQWMQGPGRFTIIVTKWCMDRHFGTSMQFFRLLDVTSQVTGRWPRTTCSSKNSQRVKRKKRKGTPKRSLTRKSLQEGHSRFTTKPFLSTSYVYLLLFFFNHNFGQFFLYAHFLYSLCGSSL